MRRRNVDLATRGLRALGVISPRSQAQAAKARVAIDKRLGEKTPAWIVALAEKAPL